MLGMKCPLRRVLDAEDESEFFQHIRPGDLISVTEKLVKLDERQGKDGRLLLTAFGKTLQNQKGEVAVKTTKNPRQTLRQRGGENEQAALL
jgi:hypothetical protein